MLKTVSIIIPTYNRASFLKRISIPSVLNQTYKNCELLIVDDGSTDNTKEVAEEFLKNDSRIKYFYQENRGPGAARNTGIKYARGEYIAFLDSDDEWLPEKLEKQVQFMEHNPDYDFCYTAHMVVFDETGKQEIKRYSNSINLPYVKLAGIGISVPSSHLYRRSVFEKVGLFDESRILIGLEDNEWSVRGYYLKGFYIDEVLTVYHIHKAQITKENMEHRIKKQIAGLKYILQKNFKMISKNKKALFFRIAQIFYLKTKYVLCLFK